MEDNETCYAEASYGRTAKKRTVVLRPCDRGLATVVAWTPCGVLREAAQGKRWAGGDAKTLSSFLFPGRMHRIPSAHGGILSKTPWRARHGIAGSIVGCGAPSCDQQARRGGVLVAMGVWTPTEPSRRIVASSPCMQGQARVSTPPSPPFGPTGLWPWGPFLFAPLVRAAGGLVQGLMTGRRPSKSGPPSGPSGFKRAWTRLNVRHFRWVRAVVAAKMQAEAKAAHLTPCSLGRQWPWPGRPGRCWGGEAGEAPQPRQGG